MSICFFCSLFLIDFYEKYVFKVIFIVISIFILTFLLWSGSRTAYVGVSIGLIFYLYFLKKNNSYFLTVFMIFCSTLISLCFTTNHPSLGIFRAYAQLGNNVDHFSSGRLAIYEKLLEYFSYHPIWGYGGEAVRQLNVYGRVQAHNSVLQILIEFGLVGLVGCIILFYRFFSEFNFKGMPLKEIFIMALLLNVFVSSLFNGGAYYGVILILACFFVTTIYADKNLRTG
nr:O-antigen ligase family protein [Acinetobacter higginsii]